MERPPLMGEETALPGMLATLVLALYLPANLLTPAQERLSLPLLPPVHRPLLPQQPRARKNLAKRKLRRRQPLVRKRLTQVFRRRAYRRPNRGCWRNLPLHKAKVREKALPRRPPYRRRNLPSRVNPLLRKNLKKYRSRNVAARLCPERVLKTHKGLPPSCQRRKRQHNSHHVPPRPGPKLLCL